MIHSAIVAGERVEFPVNRGEMIYMLPFLQRDGLPHALRHWQRTIDAMLAGIETESPIYLMIEQSRVRRGESQRRPGVHIDGNWDGARHPRHSHELGKPELLILVSNVQGCRAYIGEFAGIPWENGDCAHINLKNARAVYLEANRAYIGTVQTLHESLPVACDGWRTLVRLNVPIDHWREREP